MTVGTLRAFLKLDDADFNKGLDDAVKKTTKSTKTIQKKFSDMADSLAKTGKKMTLFITAPILAIGAAMAKTAIDAEETAQKFEVVFSSIGERATAATDRLVEGFGFAQTQAQQLLGDTGDLLTGFGFTQDSALDLSLAVNELAADLASFTNFSGGAEGASKALTKAMLGESEQAKALGVVIRQDSDEYKELVEHYMDAEGASLLQAKALTALKMATDQSKNAVGDYARTQDSAANIIRDTKNDIKDLAVELGQFLIPLIKDAATKVKDMVAKFMSLDDGTKKLILKVAALAAALGPALLAMGKMGQAVRVLIPLFKTLMSPGGLIAAGVVALGAFVIQYIKWKGVQKDNIALANENNEIIKGTVIGINRVANALNLETAQRIYKLETMRAEREMQLEMELDSLAFAERAAKDQASYIDERGFLVGMTEAEIAAQKKAIPIHEQRIELLQKSLGILDETIGKFELLEGVTLDGNEGTATIARTWQSWNEEIEATIANENILIQKQVELAEATGESFDAVAEQKKILEEALETLLSLSSEEIDEPFEVTDKTIQSLIERLKALGLTAKEIADIQIAAEERRLEAAIATNEMIQEMNAEAEEKALAILATNEEYQLAADETRLEQAAQLATDLIAIDQLVADSKEADRQADIAATKVAEDRKKKIIQSAWNMVAGLANSVSKLLTANANKEISEINEKYKDRLEAAEGDAEATKRIEKEKSDEILAIKIKEAKANKAFAIFDIALKTAQAIIGFLASPGGVAGIALSVAAAGIGLIQGIAVGTAPLPTFAEGGWVGGKSGVDQNTIRASAGEFIVNEGQASQNAGLLEAINEGRSITANIEAVAAPVMLDGQIVGQITVDFVESAANEGRLAINPQAIRADV